MAGQDSLQGPNAGALALLETAACVEAGGHSLGAVFRSLPEHVARRVSADLVFVISCSASSSTCQVVSAYPEVVSRALDNVPFPMDEVFGEMVEGSALVSLPGVAHRCWGKLSQVLVQCRVGAIVCVPLVPRQGEHLVLMVASTKPLSSGQVEEIQRTAQQAGKVLASIGMRGAQEEVASKLSWREAADSLVAVTHFARALAHDLNNALSVVIGEGHLLMDELERLTELESAQGGLQCAEAQETKKPEVRAAEDSAGQKKLQSGDADEEVVAGDARAKETLAVCRGRVRTIMERAHRLAGMARALEEYAAPRPVEPLEQVDLTVLAHEAVDITSCVWEAEGQARGCSVELRCESEGPVLVYGVPAQLRRALVHLVFNAIQAIESGSGTIVVRVYNDASEAVCEVEDTGVGMTPEVLRRAREPFFTTRPGVCKGLGLSLADAIVRQHGGEMSMDTQPGRGTRVTIYLPGV